MDSLQNWNSPKERHHVSWGLRITHKYHKPCINFQQCKIHYLAYFFIVPTLRATPSALVLYIVQVHYGVWIEWLWNRLLPHRCSLLCFMKPHFKTVTVFWRKYMFPSFIQSTGPFTRPLAHSLAPLTHLLALQCSLRCAHSLASELRYGKAVFVYETSISYRILFYNLHQIKQLGTFKPRLSAPALKGISQLMAWENFLFWAAAPEGTGGDEVL